MKKHIVFQLLLSIAVLAALLLVLDLLARSVLAAPPGQEGVSDLVIVKTADGDGTIGPGQAVWFHIAVTNTGEITATNVAVQDDYDEAALPIIEAGASGAQNDGDMIAWQVGDLPPGAGWSTSYQATAAGAFVAGATKVSNAVSVYADGAAIAQAKVELAIRAPQLTITRQRERVDGEGEIVPGATVRHSIRYSNNGTAPANNVVIEETYDSTVVQGISVVTGGGQQDGGTIRWSLGTVAAGASGEVSYEVTLKPALAPGDSIEVANQATISADGTKPVEASDAFTLRTPLLSIDRGRDDLNGGKIEPGDTLRFTIRIRNSGEAAASNVVVKDDFDETVVADVSDISAGGSEEEGTIEWSPVAPLEPGEEQTFTYKVRLISEIGQSTTVANKAIIYIRDVELARAQTTMTIEPPPPEEEEAPQEQPQVFQKEPATVAWLVGVSAVIALVTVGGLALLILKQGQWKDRYLRIVIEGVSVVVIVEAVLILAMNKSIEPDGAVTILSGIAGYLLGRSLGGDGNSSNSS